MTDQIPPSEGLENKVINLKWQLVSKAKQNLFLKGRIDFFKKNIVPVLIQYAKIEKNYSAK